jgi:MarR family transcriptional regulator, multiple antibiotic resistance protein MarR
MAGSNLYGNYQATLSRMSRRRVVSPPARRPSAAQPDLSVGHLMGRARASLLASLDAQLAPFGLSGMQFAALKHLAEGAADTAAGLSRFMHYDTGAMTRIVDRLEQRRLLRRERCREDRRVVFLRLTPAGRAHLQRLMAVASRVLETHLAGFSTAEIGILKSYLGRMIDNGAGRVDNRALHAGI